MDEASKKEKEKYEKVWQFNEYRQYSPGEVDLKRLNVVQTLRDFKAKTVLDAGCGSGKMMQKLITDFPNEFEVHGFDIADNCLDPFFDNMKNDILTVGSLWEPGDLVNDYDAILCTDVMEHIPQDKVELVLQNLHDHTKKIGYYAICLQHDHFGKVLVQEPLHLTVKPTPWWLQQLTKVGYKVNSSAIEQTKEGLPIWLHVYVSP